MDLLSVMEQFVCAIYGQQCDSVDEARYRMFCSNSAYGQSLPPTRHSLEQHLKRANYQAAIYRRSLEAMINAPRPENHGWKESDNNLEIMWFTCEPAPTNVLKTVYCSCKTECASRCGCVISG
jgi:hypothetical protein